MQYYYTEIRGRPGEVMLFTGTRCDKCGGIHSTKERPIRVVTWMEALRAKALATDVHDLGCQHKTGQK